MRPTFDQGPVPAGLRYPGGRSPVATGCAAMLAAGLAMAIPTLPALGAEQPVPAARSGPPNLPNGAYQTAHGIVEFACSDDGQCTGRFQGEASGSQKSKRIDARIDADGRMSGYWHNVFKGGCSFPTIDTATGVYGRIAFQFSADRTAWKGHASQCDGAAAPGGKGVVSWDGAREGATRPDPLGLHAFLDGANREQGIPVEFIRPALDRLKVSFGTVAGGDTANYSLDSDTVRLAADLEAGGRLKPYAAVSDNRRPSVLHELFHAWLDWVVDIGGDGTVVENVEKLKATVNPVYRLESGCSKPENLSDSQKYKFIQERWAHVYVEVITAHRVAWGKFGTAAAALADIASTLGGYAREGTFTPYWFHWAFRNSKIFASKESIATVDERRFLLGHVMGFDDAFLNAAYGGVTTPACPR